MSKPFIERLVAAGTCVKCRNPVEPSRRGKQLCASCTQKQREHNRQRSRQFRVEGRCGNCGKRDANTDKGRYYCLQCALRQSRNYEKSKEKKKTAGAATPNGQ